MRRSNQRGSLYQHGGWWVLRYRGVLFENGQPKPKHFAHKLVQVSEYPTLSSVRPLAAEFLLAEERIQPSARVSLLDFIEKEYLPFVKANKKPTTLKGYTDIFELHVRPLLDGTLRDFKPWDGTRMLAEIAKKGLSRRSMYRVKSFLSGAFSHAISQGWLDSTNPIRDAKLPGNLPAPQETHAYSLEEIDQILNLPGLDDTARLAVALAAFTGLRKSELRGLRWEDYDGTSISVRRAIVNGIETTCKNDASRASIPVLPRLQRMLNAARKPFGWILQNDRGGSLNLQHLGTWHLGPALKVIGSAWHGWHAFRRGLATNLSRLGTDLKTIQAVLRHSSQSTTLQVYIKSVPADAFTAMERLEAALPKREYVQ